MKNKKLAKSMLTVFFDSLVIVIQTVCIIGFVLAGMIIISRMISIRLLTVVIAVIMIAAVWSVITYIRIWREVRGQE